MKKILEIAIIDKRDELTDQKLVSSIIEKILKNPFIGFEEMGLNYKEEYERLDPEKALKNLLKRLSANVKFKTRSPFNMIASINKDKIHNTIIIKTDDPNNLDHNCDSYKTYASELAGLLPELIYANINPTGVNSGDFYYENDIELVPSNCVRLHVGWWHLLPPKSYLVDYTREEMLNIPAYKVKEHENGVIEMQVWENPFEYDKPENIEQLKKVVNYMRSVHKKLKGKI